MATIIKSGQGLRKTGYNSKKLTSAAKSWQYLMKMSNN
jgi:hypothetical protein